MKKRLRRWLIERADNYQQNLRVLIFGFSTFLFGGLMTVASNFFIREALAAELVALCGLILMGIGIILALFGYICLSVLRLFRYFTDDLPDD